MSNFGQLSSVEEFIRERTIQFEIGSINPLGTIPEAQSFRDGGLLQSNHGEDHPSGRL
jgi:hypothetical protein